MNEPNGIHAAILAAMRDIAKTGIAKLGQADAGGARYTFRGIDQAMNEMSPILINNGITVTPRYSDLHVQERAKGDPKDAKATRFVTLKGAFTFAAGDGSTVIAEAYGEAMDSGDKATTKAQSVAFRTVLFQQFIVPLMAMDTELSSIEDMEEQEAKRRQWIDDQVANIAGAKSAGDLKSIVSVAMAKVKELGDTEAEHELQQAIEAKLATAKPKEGTAK